LEGNEKYSLSGFRSY